VKISSRTAVEFDFTLTEGEYLRLMRCLDRCSVSFDPKRFTNEHIDPVCQIAAAFWIELDNARRKV